MFVSTSRGAARVVETVDAPEVLVRSHPRAGSNPAPGDPPNISKQLPNKRLEPSPPFLEVELCL